MADIRYRAEIRHTEKTIQRLYRTQYYAYDKPRLLLRGGLGAALILLAAFAAMPTWLRALALLLGAWLAVSGDFPAQLRADRALEQRKAALPHMFYTFYGDRLMLSGEGRMDIPYRKLSRLAQDESYLYLFVSRDSVCMLERASLKPEDAEGFMKFLAEKTGLVWRREKGLLSLNLADLILLLRDWKKP